MPLKVTTDAQQQGGVNLSPAAQFLSGVEFLAGVRAVTKKFGQVLLSRPIGVSEAWQSPWFDTNQTGGTYISANCFLNTSLNSVSNAFQIQGTNNPGNSNSLTAIAVSASAQVGSSQVFNLQGTCPYRYWRVTLTNNTNVPTVTEVTAVEFNIPMGVSVFQPLSGKLLATTQVGDASTGGYADGLEYVGLSMTTNAGVDVPSFMPAFVTSAVPGSGTQSTFSAARTPNIFRGGMLLTTAGGISIWQPSPTKKIRLMKYKIEVGEDATGGGSNPVPFALGFAWGANAAALTQGYNNTSGYLHRFVVPASTPLATSGNIYDSGWIDLGNGIICGASGAALFAGLNIPQATSAINPTWTIASNQWEAITIGFKTTGAKGNFSLVSSDFASAAATTVPFGAKVLAPTDTVIIVARTTNSVTGIPVFSATDTAGNTYIASAVTTNASDGGNGSSLCILSCTNCIGNNANIVTVAATNSPTQIGALYLDYSGPGMGSGGVDAALVGATGNSTAPASGNYTPATAGDLIIAAMASSTQLGAVPTISLNFFVRGALLNANQKTIAVADNFGNGALAAGAVNIVACGTEE